MNSYTKMMSYGENNKAESRLKNIDLIECGGYLYVDDFAKKYTDFKKKIFTHGVS